MIFFLGLRPPNSLGGRGYPYHTHPCVPLTKAGASASFRLATALSPATQGRPSSASFTDPVTISFYFLAPLQAFFMPVRNPPKLADPKLRSN